MKLYMKGGMPAQACRVLKDHGVANRSQWLDTLAAALTAAGLYEKAGECLEELGQLQRAMDCYVKGANMLAHRTSLMQNCMCYALRTVRQAYERNSYILKY